MKNPEYSYGMRTIAGAYLMYLAYQICSGYFSGESEGIHFLLIGLLFLVSGVACVINGIRYFMFGKMNKDDRANDRFSLEEEPEITTENKEDE